MTLKRLSTFITTNKLNPISIVRDHLKTLIRYDTKKASRTDYVLFFGFPLIIAVASYWIFEEIGSQSANILIATFSIFVGLLLNLLLIVYDLVKKTPTTERGLKLKRDFLREIFANVSYSILVSISILVFLLLTLVNRWGVAKLASVVVYFLAGNFFLTLLMVLKRIHILLAREFDEGA